MPIELGNSWFSTKIIEVVRPCLLVSHSKAPKGYIYKVVPIELRKCKNRKDGHTRCDKVPGRKGNSLDQKLRSSIRD